MAARSLIVLFRKVNPELLHRKDKVCSDLTQMYKDEFPVYSTKKISDLSELKALIFQRTLFNCFCDSGIYLSKSTEESKICHLGKD